MAKSKKKAGTAQTPPTTRRQGKRQPEPDVAAQQLSKELSEETLTNPKKEHEGNDEEMKSVEEEAPNVKMASPPKVIKQQEEGNDAVMNNVEEETPNVKIASPLEVNKQNDIQNGGGKVKGSPEVVGEEENGIPVIEVNEQEKGIPAIQVGEEEKCIQEQGKEEAEEEGNGLQKEIEREAEAEAEDSDKVPKKPVAKEGNVLFVGNVAHSVTWNDLEAFFKDVGAVTDIRFAEDRKGYFRGFAHVDFATEAAAMKALEKDGQTLHGRNVNVKIAEKRVPGLDEERWKCTALVKGFGKKQKEDEIENILRKHFGSCGSIVGVHIPKDQNLKYLKGSAYIQFVDSGAVMKAVELNGSELDRCTLFVEEAKPAMHGKSDGGRRSGKRKRNPNEP